MGADPVKGSLNPLADWKVTTGRGLVVCPKLVTKNDANVKTKIVIINITNNSPFSNVIFKTYVREN